MSDRNFRTILCIFVLLFTMAAALAAQSAPPNAFLVHNLVSDLPGIADHQDPNLINPWGNGFGQSPFWIGNNGSGTSTLYDGTGTATALVVDIPAAGGAATGGPVTGVIFNSDSSNTAAFNVAAGKPASFLFCAEDGLISGWNSSVNSTQALVLYDNSKSGAVYKGCAIGGPSSAPLLYAANFNAGTIDVFDANFNPVVNPKAFQNPAIPAGFAPFNIQNIASTLYVVYAKQDAMKHDDVAGLGNGYLATFDLSGNLIANVISQSALNSPWGMAIAPASFGPFAGLLLVGNFGDGKINAFNASIFTSGNPVGTLNDLKGNPISIPGLWSINFGSGARNEDPGTLYFTAGIGGGPNNDPVESHGLLGSIQGVPFFPASGIVSSGSLLAGPIAPNAWATIKGNELSATIGSWNVTSNTLPTAVNDVGVTVNGEAAPVSYVSNTQINFLVPGDIPAGTAKIQTTNNGLASATASAPVALLAPAFFITATNATSGNDYVTATHANGSLVGPSATIKGATPAAPGETITVYGTGFGETSPPYANGQVVSTVLALPTTPTFVIDGFVAQVSFAGLVGPGVYSFSVVVPEAAQSADDLIVALLGDGETQANAFITVAAP